jgi:hypothetical protein
MTIQEAFQTLISTQTFKEIAKQKDRQGGHYRMLLSRYRRDTLKYGAMVDILLEYGYKVTVK